MPDQGLLDLSGVVLGRSRMGEGGLWLTLFLKGQGLLRASAPGAEAGRVRFGGGTEPLVWGKFHLHQRRGLCLNSVDIADDMLPLRRRPRALLMAVRWSKLILRWLPADHPDDGLLANLYWNMRLLALGKVPEEAAEWRFLWRWLTLWGLAPDLGRCGRCGRELSRGGAWRPDEGLVCLDCDGSGDRPAFTADELRRLRWTAAADAERVSGEKADNENVPFALASRCAAGLLSREV